MSAETTTRSIVDTNLLTVNLHMKDGSITNLTISASVLVPAYLAAFSLLREGFIKKEPRKAIIGGIAALGLYKASVEIRKADKELQELRRQGANPNPSS